MTIIPAPRQKALFYCILVLGIALTAAAPRLRANSTKSTNGTLPTGLVVPLHPLNKVRHQLDSMKWKDEVIEEYIRKTWATSMSFMETWKKKQEGKKRKKPVTTITTSCHDTAPWLVVSLLELPKMKTIRYGISRLPEDSSLVIYNNTDRPRSADPEPLIANIRTFVASRPKDEQIVLQADMIQVVAEDSKKYVDHHIMMHIYDGQINLYQSWYRAFTLLDWMGNPTAFAARYPMDLETFLYHYEVFLSPFDTEESILRRQESVWYLFGLTNTKTWTVDKKGNPMIDDYIVSEMDEGWVVPLVTYWPNEKKTTTMTAETM